MNQGHSLAYYINSDWEKQNKVHKRQTKVNRQNRDST